MTKINEHLCLYHAGAIADQESELGKAQKKIQKLEAEVDALKLQLQMQNEKHVAEVDALKLQL